MDFNSTFSNDSPDFGVTADDYSDSKPLSLKVDCESTEPSGFYRKPVQCSEEELCINGNLAKHLRGEPHHLDFIKSVSMDINARNVDGIEQDGPTGDPPAYDSLATARPIIGSAPRPIRMQTVMDRSASDSHSESPGRTDLNVPLPGSPAARLIITGQPNRFNRQPQQSIGVVINSSGVPGVLQPIFTSDPDITINVGNGICLQTGRGSTMIYTSSSQPKQNKMDPSSTSPVPQRKITDHDIHILSEHLGNRWRDLGRKIGFTNGQMDVLQHDFGDKGLKEIIVQMFNKWRRTYGDNSSISYVVKALKYLNLHSMAARIPPDQ